MTPIYTDSTLRTAVIPRNSSLINYSILKEYYSPHPFRSFSIKYVVEGSELYSVNGTKYHVQDKQYLLANKFSEGFVEVDSKKSVKGICIDLAPEILSEVVASYRRPDTCIPDLELDVFFNTPAFLENKYAATQTHVGRFLTALEKQLAANPGSTVDFTREFYFRISEALIADHIPVFEQLQSIKAIKNQTKKDLLRKLYAAKEWMDHHFLSGNSIPEVAIQAGISEYHFYRLFKQTFKITPHQYLLKKRLSYALEMMKQGAHSVSDLAFAAGFTDIFTFSKSFKKHFGFSPSQKHNSQFSRI